MSEACVSEIWAEYKDKIKPDEIAEIIDQLNKVEGNPELVRKLTERLLRAVEDDAVRTAKDRVYTEISYQRVKKDIDNLIQKGLSKTKLDALNDISAHNVYGRGEATFLGQFGEFVNEMEESKLSEYLFKGNEDIERELARTLWLLEDDVPASLKTENKMVQKGAEIIRKHQRISMERINNVGGMMTEREGYIVRQTHDSFKIRKAGYDKWKADIMDKLDIEKTFEGKTDTEIDSIMRDIYLDITTGKRTRMNEDGTIDMSYGNSSLSKKMSQHRTFEFKDADTWFDYNKMYGTGSMLQTITGSMRQMAKTAALMETYGPTPMKNFKRILDELTAENRKVMAGVKKKKPWHKNPVWSGGRIERAWHLYHTVSGRVDLPVDSLLGKVMLNIRKLQTMAKLGGVFLSQPSDLGFGAAFMSSVGKNYYASLANLMYNTAGNMIAKIMRLEPNERTRFARSLGAGLEGMLGDVYLRYSAIDSDFAKNSKMIDWFYKMTGMSLWTDSAKQASILQFSNHLASYAGDNWKKLPRELTSYFERFGIDEAKWDLVRKSVREIEGRTYLDPKAISYLGDEEILPLVKELYPNAKPTAWPTLIKEYRNSLEQDVRTMYFDAMDTAIPTPGARERAVQTQGVKRGTFVGEALASFWQFKTFPHTIMSKVVPNLHRPGMPVSSAIMSYANMIAATTTLGYVSLVLKDIAKGRTPRDVRKHPLKSIIAAFTQGGGAGLYGDFLFGTHSRFGSGPLEALAGPTASMMGDVARLYIKARDQIVEGRGAHYASNITQLVTQNTPFINLFYTRAVFDYLILHGITERLSPGSVRRYKRSIKKEWGQETLDSLFY